MITKITQPQKPSFYPANFLVMTTTSLLFSWAMAGLSAILIHYWLTGVSGILNDKILIFWIALIAVVTPMHLLAYWQVRRTDKSQITTFSLRFAHLLLGTFLFVVVGSNIIFMTLLLAFFLNALVGTGEFDKLWLAASLSLLQAITWFWYITTHFSAVRVNRPRPKYYVITVSTLGVLVMLLSAIFPLMAYRNVAHDFVKETDLVRINNSIADYTDTHDNLPAKLTDLKELNNETVRRLGDYQYTAKGETKFGIFGYELCATFTNSEGKDRDTGFGFDSHSAGKQCFTRTTISFNKLNQDLAQYAKSLQEDEAKLWTTIQNFLLGAKNTVDQEISGIEGFAGSQVKGLERNLEGLEGGTGQLQQEMERLESNLTGLGGNTAELAQDFAAVEKFFHDLGCLFGGCTTSQQ